MQYRTETETDDLLLILRLFSVEILGFSGLMISISCHFFGIKYSVLVLEFMAMGLAKGTQLNSTMEEERIQTHSQFQEFGIGRVWPFWEMWKRSSGNWIGEKRNTQVGKNCDIFIPTRVELEHFFIICVWITQYVTRASRLISTRIDTTQNVSGQRLGRSDNIVFKSQTLTIESVRKYAFVLRYCDTEKQER